MLDIKTINFITEANTIHELRYNYDKTVYIKSNIDVIVTCKKHGDFNVTPNNHISKKSGCKECKKKTNQHFHEFITEANYKFNHKFNYIKDSYTNNRTKMTIICELHGSYTQSPQTHLKVGCKECNEIKRLCEMQAKFLYKSSIIHNHLYGYALVIYRGVHIDVDIICKKHGVFQQTPNSHLKGHGCNKCKMSKGELKISNFLDGFNIKYTHEYKFNKCRNKYRLPFDFYLLDCNICIEYDGIQHFQPVEIFGGISEFVKTKRRDSIKDNYCTSNNIRLIRISYHNFDYIKDILIKELNITKYVHND